jgi:hypothetical protein
MEQAPSTTNTFTPSTYEQSEKGYIVPNKWF